MSSTWNRYFYSSNAVSLWRSFVDTYPVTCISLGLRALVACAACRRVETTVLCHEHTLVDIAYPCWMSTGRNNRVFNSTWCEIHTHTLSQYSRCQQFVVLVIRPSPVLKWPSPIHHHGLRVSVVDARADELRNSIFYLLISVGS